MSVRRPIVGAPPLLFASALAIAAGCGAPTGPVATGPGTSPTVSVHGVISVPEPGSAGVQGRAEPWLVADDGSEYDLVLEPPFAILADPASAGRGVTLAGEVLHPPAVPVGSPDRVLRVTGYRFDGP